jgi:predicted deacylase
LVDPAAAGHYSGRSSNKLEEVPPVAEKLSGFLETTEADGGEIRIPKGVTHGASDGPTFLIVAGVHGSEYDGIEAVKRLFSEINEVELRGTVITIPCLNIPAFYGLAAHVNPIDNVNPGRAFPGDPSGSYTERVTALVWELAEDADFIIDVHGGDIEEKLVEYSQVNLSGDARVDAAAEGLARALDMPFLVLRPAPEALPSSNTSLHVLGASKGKPAILSEAGSHGELDERTVEIHLRGLKNALRHTGMLPGDVQLTNHDPMVLHRFTGINAPAEGFWYPRVAKGDVIRKGDVVGEMSDFFGNHLAEVTADENAAILGVISTPARREGDLLLGLGTLD